MQKNTMQPIRVADGFVDVQISGMPFDNDGLSRLTKARREKTTSSF